MRGFEAAKSESLQLIKYCCELSHGSRLRLRRCFFALSSTSITHITRQTSLKCPVCIDRMECPPMIRKARCQHRGDSQLGTHLLLHDLCKRQHLTEWSARRGHWTLLSEGCMCKLMLLQQNCMKSRIINIKTLLFRHRRWLCWPGIRLDTQQPADQVNHLAAPPPSGSNGQA